MSTEQLETSSISLTKADEKMVAQTTRKAATKKKLPNAKYIRNYTQKLIKEKLIPFMSKTEREEVTFAAAVHKSVVYYMDRKGIS